MGVLCFICNKVFSNQGNLNKHKRIVHDVKQINSVQYAKHVAPYKCLEGCAISFKFNSNLRIHLSEKHNITSEVIELDFTTLNEFESWLKVLEQENGVQYEKSTGTKKCNGNGLEKLYYECCRSGKARLVSEKSRKRTQKTQGSCKMNYCCTSQIILTRDNTTNKCFMKYFKTHYGHEGDIQHLRFSKLSREIVASKLVAGVSPGHVLNSIRDHIGVSLRRNDLLTRKDINNVKISYNIYLRDGYRHKNDSISVNLWVQEMRQSEQNIVLFYKNQREESVTYQLDKNDFVLIIMYQIQSDILKKFGNKIVCIDGTHGLNPYDFELTTLLVIDEYGQGFPTSFMFSNRKDTFVYELFFMEIKKIVGTLSTETFMSDITNVYYNAWKNVMGITKNHLFCSWHIDRAWQHNLSKVIDQEKRQWVYKTLKYLQTTLDEEEFKNGFIEFLNILDADKNTKAMSDYLKSNYQINTFQWAYCYRKKCGINTNMYLENMHKVVKYVYLKGKKIKRLDKSINALQKFIKDKIIDRVIKLTKGKYTEHQTIINKRHRSALASKFDIHFLEDKSYLLKDENKEYLVTKGSSQISCCELKCKFCSICIHNFECTCVDYAIKTTICKHIHFICLNTVNNAHCNTKDEMKTDEVHSLVKGLNSKTHSRDDLINQIQSTALEIINNSKMLNHSEEKLKLILQNLKTTASISSLSHEVTENKANLSPIAKKTPVNKNIEKQSFFSTKKKCKRPICNNKKPDVKEQKIIKELLTKSLYISNNSEFDHSYCTESQDS